MASEREEEQYHQEVEETYWKEREDCFIEALIN